MRASRTEVINLGSYRVYEQLISCAAVHERVGFPRMKFEFQNFLNETEVELKNSEFLLATAFVQKGLVKTRLIWRFPFLLLEDGDFPEVEKTTDLKSAGRHVRWLPIAPSTRTRACLPHGAGSPVAAEW